MPLQGRVGGTSPFNFVDRQCLRPAPTEFSEFREVVESRLRHLRKQRMEVTKTASESVSGSERLCRQQARGRDPRSWPQMARSAAPGGAGPDGSAASHENAGLECLEAPQSVSWRGMANVAADKRRAVACPLHLPPACQDMLQASTSSHHHRRPMKNFVFASLRSRVEVESANRDSIVASS
jgi:hypothetical protein